MHVIHNKFPCCNKSTGFKITNYSIGDVIIRECSRCGTKFRITFVQPSLGIEGFIKLEWERCQTTLTGTG